MLSAMLASATSWGASVESELRGGGDGRKEDVEAGRGGGGPGEVVERRVGEWWCFGGGPGGGAYLGVNNW